MPEDLAAGMPEGLIAAVLEESRAGVLDDSDTSLVGMATGASSAILVSLGLNCVVVWRLCLFVPSTSLGGGERR